MKVLSIDVGIKNLALCLFEKSPNTEHFKVIKWDVINLTEEETLKCSFLDKNSICNKPAKFKKENQCFCVKHSKKQKFNIPTPEQKHSFINKQKINKLYEIADSHGIKYDNKSKKVDLVNLINEYIQNNYFETIESKKASEVDLFNIGVNIKNKFNETLKDETKIDYVIIENQIGPLAIRMKTIQGMLVQYFVMSPVEVKHVEFISAANKLKDCDIKDKSKYSDRKKLGITKCLETITSNSNYSGKLDYFNAHKKKDDLADSFLQGLWFL